MNANELPPATGSQPEMDVAMGTRLPDHFRKGDPLLLNVALSRGHEVVLIESIEPTKTSCTGTLPQNVEVSGNGKLYAACAACGMTFGWSRLTHTWS